MIEEKIKELGFESTRSTETACCLYSRHLNQIIWFLLQGKSRSMDGKLKYEGKVGKEFTDRRRDKRQQKFVRLIVLSS